MYQQALRSALVCGTFVPLLLVTLGDAQEAVPTTSVGATEVRVPVHSDALHLALELSAAEGPAATRAGTLVEASQPGEAIPAQWSPAPADDGTQAPGDGQLIAIVPAGPPAAGERSYRFHAGSAPTGTRFDLAEQPQGAVTVREAGQPVLCYRHDWTIAEHVPATDARRRRACYIHPLWGLSGEVLTDDFPVDHYHHHGLFWAWPHVGVGEATYDLWTYGNIEQRFLRWICREVGPVAAVLAVENGWFVGEQQVLTERVWVRVFPRSQEERVIDLSLFLIPGEQPVTLQGAEGKSYGGLTLRFAPPSRSESSIRTPAGLAADDLLDTPLQWVNFTSRLGGAPGLSGATLLVHPRHPDYPPSWLTRHYGALCIGWPGIEAQTLAPGQPRRLDYRICIHASSVTQEQLVRIHESYVVASRAGDVP